MFAARPVEHIVEIELPRFFRELDLSLPVRAAILQHVEELKNWLVATAHRHQNSPQYTEAELQRRFRPAVFAPIGIGTSAARLPFTAAAPR